MRRYLQPVPIAMLTFTPSALAAGAGVDLFFVVSSALAAFVFVQVLSALKPDSHYLKFGVITLTLWSALVYVVFSVFMPPDQSCIVVSVGEPPTETTRANRAEQPADATEAGGDELSGITTYTCAGAPTGLSNSNTIWAGMLDRKAIARPAPLYPASAKSATGAGVLAVSVVVDEAGRVVWAQSLSGHPL